MNDSSPHIVFAGGGTGGHLFPGLATAQQLIGMMPELRITFVGSGKAFERRHVAGAGFDYLALPCRPLPRRLREAVPFLLESMAGSLAARRLLREEDVAAVVGLGGYASVPMARAACRCDVPLVLLEQNMVPGRATRWLARGASLVCLAWAPARSSLRRRCPVRVTGTPIRSFMCVASPTASATERPAVADKLASRSFCLDGPAKEICADRSERQLLVLGGSGGAGSLNENAPRALYKIRSRLGGWRIVHQSGERGFAATQELYGKLALDATVVDFTAEMPGMLTMTDLAVCRAGGTTLAELSAAGVPAVLLPYPHAAGDHQRRNAEAFARAGAAVLLDEREVRGRLDDRLAQAISQLLGHPDQRRRMSAAMRRFARPDAAREVAAMILKLLGADPQRHTRSTAA